MTDTFDDIKKRAEAATSEPWMWELENEDNLWHLRTDIPLLCRALELACEPHFTKVGNRLNSFAEPPDYWLEQAREGLQQ